MNSQIEMLIKQATDKLSAEGVVSSAFEIRLLLAEAIDCEPGEVLSFPAALSPQQQQRFAEFIKQRCRHIPADKIIGHKGFYKYEFAVSGDVLSPRPETELLVEAALEEMRRRPCRSLLELGVGSGCVILSLLAEIPSLCGIGIDISAAALEIAARNAETLGVKSRIEWKQADWFAADFAALFSQRFDMIVSNPPYIAAWEIPLLEAEVRDYDPRLALDGGTDGLASYRCIAKVAPALLNEGGKIFLEVGEGQAGAVANLFAEQGFVPENILRDLAGTERCVILKK